MPISPIVACPRQVALEQALAPYYEQLNSHRLYRLLTDADAVHQFMQVHVFAVWDFQSLLKSLQSHLTCVQVPWVPTADPVSRRLINEIVLNEESDEDSRGGHTSHYELYLQAMRESGASTEVIHSFVEQVAQGTGLNEAFKAPAIPPEVHAFVGSTMDIIETAQPHRIAAAFAYGREEAVPVMFLKLVEQLASQSQSDWQTFLFYLERHIGLDSEEHGPQAKQVVSRLCKDDDARWLEAQESATQSLIARLQMWDQVAKRLAPSMTR